MLRLESQSILNQKPEAGISSLRDSGCSSRSSGFIIGDNVMEEIWKSIDGYRGYYDISNHGRVRSYRKMVKGRPVVCNKPQRALTLKQNGKGYLNIHLYYEGSYEQCYIHTLVLNAFVGKGRSNEECCHLDNNPINNRYDNLEWGTHKHNLLDFGTNKIVGKGEKNPMAKLSKETVLRIRQLAKAGLTYKEISDMTNVKRHNVGRIIRRQRWNHI